MDAFPDGHFGPHHASVIEVFRCACSIDWFSRQPDPASKAEIILARSPDGALDVAPCIVSEVASEALDWEDFLHLQRADYVDPKASALDSQQRWLIQGRVIEAGQALQTQLIQAMAQRQRALRGVALLTASMFGDIAMARALCGNALSFWEHIFGMLKSGGIPVGWSGNWPDGKLVVFYPSAATGLGGKN